jgi:DNA-binding HxlR family transcriptional regulator
VETTAALLRGRFSALVIWHLFWSGKRFYQLVRELEGVPRKALAHELDDLERAGIVARCVQGRGPGRVKYQLTPRGESLKIVVGAMYEWGLVARRTLGPGPVPADLEEAPL